MQCYRDRGPPLAGTDSRDFSRVSAGAKASPRFSHSLSQPRRRAVSMLTVPSALYVPLATSSSLLPLGKVGRNLRVRPFGKYSVPARSASSLVRSAGRR